MKEVEDMKAVGALTMTVPEAAKVLGISKNSAYLAAERGEIPTIRVGRRVLVPRAALDQLLASGSRNRAA